MLLFTGNVKERELMIYTHFEVKYHPRVGSSTDIKTKQKYKKNIGKSWGPSEMSINHF
jgi:hypothetical protein